MPNYICGSSTTPAYRYMDTMEDLREEACCESMRLSASNKRVDGLHGGGWGWERELG